MNPQIIDSSNPLWVQTLQVLSHDIYHLPGYATLEARRTQTIPEAIVITENDRILFAPYLLRRCDDILPEHLITEDLFDVVSPYGYPGILLSEAAIADPNFLDRALNLIKQVFQEKGVCSAFFRLHPILNQSFQELTVPETFTFTGETVSIDLTLSESELWHHTCKDHRNKINRCKRFGLTARMIPCTQNNIQIFTEIYLETMERVGAKREYLAFDYNYFAALSKTLEGMLYLNIVESEDQQITSAGLYTECHGIVQAIFGGTKTEFLKQSPTCLETDYVRSWAKARGNQFLHLGGGVGGSQDRLYRFKAGFSRQRYPFMTLRLITDHVKYHHLVELRAKALNTQPEVLFQSNFFPVYRSVLNH
jgi:hypothetical protein